MDESYAKISVPIKLRTEKCLSTCTRLHLYDYEVYDCIRMHACMCSRKSIAISHRQVQIMLASPRSTLFISQKMHANREVLDIIFRQMVLVLLVLHAMYWMAWIFNLNGLIFESGIMFFYSLLHSLYRNRIYSKSKFYRPNYRVIRSILLFISATRLKESNFVHLSPKKFSRDILYIFSISLVRSYEIDFPFLSQTYLQSLSLFEPIIREE